MILPPPCSTMCLAKCLQHSMTPRTLTMKSLSQSATGNSVAGALTLKPWALMRTWTRPMSATALRHELLDVALLAGVDAIALDRRCR